MIITYIVSRICKGSKEFILRKKDKIIFDYSMVIRAIIMMTLLGLACTFTFKAHYVIKLNYTL